MTTLTFETVREIGLTLPGVIDGTAYGAPALKLNQKILACVPTNQSAEENCIVVRIDFERRAQLLARHPEIYYITDHYEPYPSVLVRLSIITRAELSEILTDACERTSPPRVSSIADANQPRKVHSKTPK